MIFVQDTLDILYNNFLAKTAQWSVNWFNKSKFHIGLHLPGHIKHFGPAILFATEAFESFNAVIRAKSIHSNRKAPSHDIAIAFAHSSRIRHLLSGGPFKLRPDTRISISPHSIRYEESIEAGTWLGTGPAPIQLLRHPFSHTIAGYLGTSSFFQPKPQSLGVLYFSHPYLDY